MLQNSNGHFEKESGFKREENFLKKKANETKNTISLETNT